MINSLNSLKKPLFISRLLCVSLCFILLLDCTSISKIHLDSKNLIFKIRWQYSSPLEKQKHSFDSLVSVQGEHLLKLDILQPLIGVIASLILNDQTMIIYTPLQKKYYKGKFDSRVFFPYFPAFPSVWLIHILRAKAPKNWNCQKQNEKLIFCKTNYFEIQWKYQKDRLYKISLKDLKQRRIEAQVQSLSSKNLSPEYFNPSLKNLKKQDDPHFFQNF